MNIKEYLSQAKYLDAQIDSKLRQMTRLRSLATKCTSTITGMPHSKSDTCSMENSIIKLIDLENEINAEIDKLVNLKEEIMKVIRCVDKLEYRRVEDNNIVEHILNGLRKNRQKRLTGRLKRKNKKLFIYS